MDGVETKMWLLLLIILCTEKFKKYVNTFLKHFHLIYKWKVSIHYITQTPFPLPPPGDPWIFSRLAHVMEKVVFVAINFTIVACDIPPSSILHTLKNISYQMNHLSSKKKQTEEKAKVVAAVWGREFIQFLAALYRFSTRMIRRKRMYRWTDAWQNGCFRKVDDHLVHTTPKPPPPKMDVLPKNCFISSLLLNGCIQVRLPNSRDDLCLLFCLLPYGSHLEDGAHNDDAVKPEKIDILYWQPILGLQPNNIHSSTQYSIK